MKQPNKNGQYVFSRHVVLEGASPVAQMVKSLPAIQAAWVRSPGREESLEKGMAIHSRILA